MKNFTKNDEEFICENCGAKVDPLGYSSRDHCPHCLCSKHVDINPGDREAECRGLLKPIQVLPDSKKDILLFISALNVEKKEDAKQQMMMI